MPFCDGLVSLSTMSSRLVHTVSCAFFLSYQTHRHFYPSPFPDSGDAVWMVRTWGFFLSSPARGLICSSGFTGSALLFACPLARCSADMGLLLSSLSSFLWELSPVADLPSFAPVGVDGHKPPALPPQRQPTHAGTHAGTLCFHSHSIQSPPSFPLTSSFSPELAFGNAILSF